METQNSNPNGAVVVFDSGIGGLNLLYECVRSAPQFHYYYVSDNVNVPYGNKSPDEILHFTLAALSGIETLSPRALIVACNTVTATCIDKLRQQFAFPVIGIQPAIKQAAKAGGECLVLATKSTVNSPSFLSLVSRYGNKNTHVVGSENLAGFVEENVFRLPDKLPEGLLPDCRADCVVLGCTHYSFVKRQIEGKYNCPVFDGIAGTAAHFCEIVGTDDHLQPLTGNFAHLPTEKFKITFYRGNNERNKHIFKCLFNL